MKTFRVQDQSKGLCESITYERFHAIKQNDQVKPQIREKWHPTL